MEEFLRKERSGSQQTVVKWEQGSQLAFFLLLWVTCIAGNRKKRHSFVSSIWEIIASSGFCYSVEKK